jgi:UDP-galactopyranose mutase
MKYDCLIVGAGLFGAVFANVACSKGKRCLVIDRREHIGGNIYSYELEGIQIHKYGPHIFHTSNEALEIQSINNTRALAYIMEMLNSIYFISNKKDLNIMHVEKEIYT